MKRVAILQSNYIPWKGYFDLIAAVDEFILYDDVQFTKNDWRNRNRIKTPRGIEWLTVPTGGKIGRRIRDVHLPNPIWQQKHWKTLEANYGRARHFAEVAEWLAPLYLQHRWNALSDLNRSLIEHVCGYLGITTKISSSCDYQLGAGRSLRLVDLCEQAGASEYVTGPSAKAYLDESLFSQRHMRVTWFDYSGYSEYRQLWGLPFVHEVSVLDVLFNCGADSVHHVLRPAHPLRRAQDLGSLSGVHADDINC